MQFLRQQLSPNEFESALSPNEFNSRLGGVRHSGRVDSSRRGIGAAEPSVGFAANGKGLGAQGSALKAQRAKKVAVSLNSDGAIIYKQAPQMDDEAPAVELSREEQIMSKPPVRLSVALGRNSPSRRSSTGLARSPSPTARSERPTGTQKPLSTRSDSHHVPHGSESSAAAARSKSPMRHSSSVDHHRHKINSAGTALSARDGEPWQCPACKLPHPASWQVCPKNR